MARVIDFYNFLDSICPFSLQEDWDNSGLLVGDKNKEVTRAAVVLDITEDAVQYASQVGAELIISHHPVIFKAKRELLKGDAVYTLAQNSMSAICAHTNLDCANGGVKLLMMNFAVSGKSICCPRGGKRDKTITFSLNKNIFIIYSRGKVIVLI